MDNELKRLPNLNLEDMTWEKYYGKYHQKMCLVAHSIEYTPH